MFPNLLFQKPLFLGGGWFFHCLFTILLFFFNCISFIRARRVFFSHRLPCRWELWLQHTQAFRTADSGIKRLLQQLAACVTWLPKRLTQSVPLLPLVPKPADIKSRLHLLQSHLLLALWRNQCCITACVSVTAGRQGQGAQQINQNFQVCHPSYRKSVS